MRSDLFRAPGENDASYKQRCAKTPPLESNLFYSNKGLSPFEGGATWIEDGIPLIQLRKAFETQSSFLGYTREEVLNHERVHAMRAGFEEPIFEEFMAYSTSSKWWRRIFGPLFRYPHETWIALFCPPYWLYLLTRLGRNHIYFNRAKKCFTNEELFQQSDATILNG